MLRCEEMRKSQGSVLVYVTADDDEIDEADERYWTVVNFKLRV